MTRTLQERPGLPARSRWIVCSHEPQCPSAGHTARVAARVIAGHPEQGWSLLCNGIVLFDDGGLLLPDGGAFAAHPRGGSAPASHPFAAFWPPCQGGGDEPQR